MSDWPEDELATRRARKWTTQQWYDYIIAEAIKQIDAAIRREIDEASSEVKR